MDTDDDESTESDDEELEPVTIWHRPGCPDEERIVRPA